MNVADKHWETSKIGAVCPQYTAQVTNKGSQYGLDRNRHVNLRAGSGALNKVDTKATV